MYTTLDYGNYEVSIYVDVETLLKDLEDDFDGGNFGVHTDNGFKKFEKSDVLEMDDILDVHELFDDEDEMAYRIQKHAIGKVST